MANVEMPSFDKREPTPEWFEKALCKSGNIETDAFFPLDGVGIERARRYCSDCQVRGDCLEYALSYRIDHGVWGGASERDRRRILRQRRLTA